MSRGIFTAIVAIIIAQLLKIPFNRKKQKTANKSMWATVFQSGGMPSSHSAGVSALATFTGLKLGVRTVDFALSVIFGLIVMYDAQGIRRYAGETSMKVNEMEAKVEELSGESTGDFHERKERQLKEELGHQPEEVAVGALLGVLIGGLSYLYNKRKP